MLGKKEGSCSYWRCANRVGLFLGLIFVICFFWVRPADLKDLHQDLLRMAFLGFDGLNAKSFLLGLLQSYVLAFAGVGLWRLVGCCMKNGQYKK